MFVGVVAVGQQLQSGSCAGSEFVDVVFVFVGHSEWAAVHAHRDGLCWRVVVVFVGVVAVGQQLQSGSCAGSEFDDMVFVFVGHSEWAAVHTHQAGSDHRAVV